MSRLGLRGSRRPPRLTLTTRAPLSTAQWIARDSAWTEIVPFGGDDLRDHQLRGRGEARDADVVVELRGDDPRHDRPVPARVLGRAADEALRHRDLTREVGVGRGRSRSRSPRRGPARAAAASPTRRTRGSRPRTTASARAGRSGRTRPAARGRARPRRRRRRRAPRPAAGRRRARGAARGWSARSPVARSIAAATARRSAPGASPTVVRARRGRAPGGASAAHHGERPEEGAPAHAATRTVSGGPPRPSAESR